MQVYIKTPDGNTYSIEVLESDTIKNLKAKIYDKIAVPPFKQILKFKEELLEDGKNLKEYKIGSKSMLELNFREGIQIFAKRQSGNTIQLEVEGSDTIATVKMKIKAKENILPSKQILIWNGNELEDNQSIQECKISRKSVLDLIVEDEPLSGNTARMLLKRNGDLKKELFQLNKVIGQMKVDMEQIQSLFVSISKLKHTEQQCQQTSIIESAPLLQASNEINDTSQAKTVEKASKQEWAIPQAKLDCNGVHLDEGKWGYVVKTNYNDQVVAATCLSDEISCSSEKDFADKINQSAHFCHCNLVKFIGATPDKPSIIVMESMDTTLQKAIDTHLPSDHNKSILMDVAKGLVYLHDIQVVHGSVNPSRIFLQLDNTAKLSHPAVEHFTHEDSIEVTTPAGLCYTAPEANKRSFQTEKSDVYSYGVLITHLLIRKSTCDHSPVGLLNFLQSRYPIIMPILIACKNTNPSKRSPIGHVIEQLKTVNFSTL